MAGDTLKFFDYRKPKLEAGDYTFEVTQTYGDPNGATITPLAQTVNIKVQGDRIRINPDQVFAKYPPAGEKGNFNDTIPHISLKKPTLPWERSAYNFDDDDLYGSRGTSEVYEPWIYLMLINEEDINRGDALAQKSNVLQILTKELMCHEIFTRVFPMILPLVPLVPKKKYKWWILKKSFFKALLQIVKRIYNIWLMYVSGRVILGDLQNENYR